MRTLTFEDLYYYAKEIAYTKKIEPNEFNIDKPWKFIFAHSTKYIAVAYEKNNHTHLDIFRNASNKECDVKDYRHYISFDFNHRIGYGAIVKLYDDNGELIKENPNYYGDMYYHHAYITGRYSCKWDYIPDDILVDNNYKPQYRIIVSKFLKPWVKDFYNN
jgi:hypothetical protein